MAWSGWAHAADVTPESEYGRRIKVYQTVQPHGETAFGENVNLYTGDLTFHQTDVVLEGQGPAITLARNSVTFLADTKILAPYAFGDWQLSIPRIQTLADRNHGWVPSTSKDPAQRCSQFEPPYYAMLPESGWHGFELITETGERQPLIKRGPANTLKPSAPIAGVASFPIVTRENWQVGCLPTAGNPAGVGEGFLAVSPNGTRYWFNHLVYDQANTVYERDGGTIIRQRRDLATMYVTRIEDRFGNRLTYTYGGDDTLDAITATDGRRVDIRWRTDARVIDSITVQPAAAKPRVWHYEYSNLSTEGATLTGVVLPDSSRWSFALSEVGGGTLPNSPECYTRTRANSTTSSLSTITHPSGLVGKFWRSGRWHARSLVPSACVWPSAPAEAEPYEDNSPLFGTSSLIKKEISGPGIAPKTWTYDYQPAAGSTTYDACAKAGTCATTKWVKVVNPAGDLTTYTFSNRWDTTEGQLLRTDEYQGTTGAAIRSEILTYAAWNQGPWPTLLGTAFDDVRTNAGKGLAWMPVKARQILQQGRQFNWQATAFDAFAKPLTVTRSSNLDAAYTRTDTTAYFNSLSLWVLGQVQSSTNTNTTPNLVESRTAYDPATALPLKTFAFEKLQQSLTYNVDGTLATVSDARDSTGFNTTVVLADWERGIPKKITFPDGSFKSAEVDDFGQLTWAEDEVGNRTCYQFDGMGRLSKITYPSDTVLHTCDESRWNPLQRAFAPVAAAEYGIGAGHWKESVNTGTGFQVTYFDGLWRPVVVERYDNTNATTKAATLTQTVTRYAPQGGVAFQSYPVNKGTAINVSDATVKGTRTTYDALGRPTRIEQDGEYASPLVTTHEYRAGFETWVTNPRGASTLTRYLAFDQPTTDLPVTIAQPEGAITNIARDVFGKVKSIVRRNNDSSLAVMRAYTYNAAQELCRSVEPETGATLMGYDAAGNLAWSASGLAASTPCDLNGTSAAVLERRSTRTYDHRNRLVELTFADGLGDQTWTYTEDGLPKSVWTYNLAGRGLGVNNAYAYNSRRLLGGTGESLHQEAWYTWGHGYGYDRNGHVTVELYPDGSSVNYAVNALGQTTGITGTSGTYVSGASYHPSGALKQFTYGNGIEHTLTQNARGLPERSRDAFGSLVVLDDSYDYDFNGNVASISDGRTNGQMSRTMTYDGLDRLTSVDSPMFAGTLRYTYDVLDNIATLTAPANPATGIAARDWRYCYGNNRLAFIRTGAANCSTGAAAIAFQFDAQGNLQQKNAQGYVFSQDNRLRGVANVEYYRYDAHGRRILGWSPTLGNQFAMYADDGRLVHQTTRDGKGLSHIYLAGSLVVTRERVGGTGALALKFQHTDALGTPVAVTDATRTVVERSEYEPYGRVINRALRDRPGYTGHAEDALTGLTYIQQRYYDPICGCFLSVDPVTAYANPAFNFNRYWYANNNPYKFTDPDGREVRIVFVRDTYTDNSVTSRMTVTSDRTDKTFNGFALEDRHAGPAGNKDPLTPGTYDAFTRTDGPRGFRLELKDTPNFKNVQIHVGNDTDDVMGCFAAGSSRSEDFVGGSKAAMKQIQSIVNSDGSGKITVEVKGSSKPPEPPPPPPKKEEVAQ